jgi:cellulose biosynthesis protein BcsQ
VSSAQTRARRSGWAANKGGVGKTMWTIEIGGALARRGRRVLIVDMDPQANATRRLGIRLDDETPTITTVLESKASAQPALQACGWDVPESERIDVLPSDIDLETIALQAGAPGALLRLRNALDPLAGYYDHILIDMPPRLDHLTQLAVTALGDGVTNDGGAAGQVFLPLDPTQDAIKGATRTRAFVEEYAEALHVPQLTIRAVLVNMVDNRTNLHKGRIEMLPKSFKPSDFSPAGVPIWEPSLATNARLRELEDAARPMSSDPTQKKQVEFFDGIAKKLDEGE